MDKHRVNIFIALVLVLIIIAAVSAWLTGSNMKDTAPTETAQPTPGLTPSVITTAPTAEPTETAAPEPTATPETEPSEAPQPSQAPGNVNRTINESGSFESNTGTNMIMYLNWSAVSQNSETVTIKIDLTLSTYALSIGPHNGIISVNGTDYRFTSAGVTHTNNDSRNTTNLTSTSINVTVPAGQSVNIPVSAVWDFNGTYNGKPITQISAGGTISLHG